MSFNLTHISQPHTPAGFLRRWLSSSTILIRNESLAVAEKRSFISTGPICFTLPIHRVPRLSQALPRLSAALYLSSQALPRASFLSMSSPSQKIAKVGGRGSELSTRSSFRCLPTALPSRTAKTRKASLRPRGSPNRGKLQLTTVKSSTLIRVSSIPGRVAMVFDSKLIQVSRP